MSLLPIRIVVPCFERPHALRRTLPSLLRQPVAEIVVVDDGSREPLAGPVREIAGDDRRLSVLRLPRNRGSAAARNAGAETATAGFVLFGDDDVVLAPDYVATLHAHLLAQGAGVAAGRRLWLAPGEAIDEARARCRRRVDPSALVDCRRFVYDDEADFEHDLPAPLVGATMLVRRELLREVSYDESLYRRGGFREETDFQVQARRAGARLLACPHALAFHLSKRELGRAGGQRKGRLLAYEWSVLRNDAAFRRKHFAALRDELGFRPGPTPWLGALRAYLGFRVPSKVRHLLGRDGP